MANTRNLERLHRFLSRQVFYPLTFSSLLVTAIFVARALYSDTYAYAFLPWNLFLAWIPYLFALVVALLHHAYPRRWWLLILPAGMWLLFLPNAPYLVTDLLHLQDSLAAPVWYDIGMFALFAWTGCFLGLVSLNIVQGAIKDYIGPLLSWLFAGTALVLSGLGIYLGRMLEWNSWDLITRPSQVLEDVAFRLAHPVQFFGFTFMFTAFLFICYWTFVSIQHRERR